MKKLMLAFTGLLFATIFAQSVFAVGVSPAKFVFNAEPGELIESEVTVINNSKTDTEDFVLIPGSYTYNESGGKTFLGPDQDIPEYSTQLWTDVGEGRLTIPPKSDGSIPVSFKVPSDATPGTHIGIIFIGGAEDAEQSEGNTGISLSGRVGLIVNITVSGATNEKLVVESFGLDEAKMRTGAVEFVTNLKNEGDSGSVPVGNIKIYDSSNNQLMGIIRQTEELNGETIVTGLKDEIKFNQAGSPILPGSTKTYPTQVKGFALKAGEYKAVLTLFYGLGDSQKTLEHTANIEVKIDFSLDSFSTDGYHSGLPVQFEGTFSNNGNKKIVGAAAITVRNMFGMTKEVINLNQIALDPTGTFDLGPNAKWENGLALGLYSAELSFLYNDGANEAVKSVSFWVISWWQALIVIVVLLLIILGLYKAIHKYNIMKKKMNKMEHEKDEKKEE